MAPPRPEYGTLFAATYSAEASGGEATLVTASLRDGDDDEGQTGHTVEVWGQAPVVYVPDDPDDGGRCQALTVQLGGNPVAIATRDLRAAKAVPGLSKGDAAFCCPTGRVTFLAKKDGTVGMMQRGEGETPDSLVLLEPDGAFSVTTPFGQIILDAQGFRVIGPNGEAMGLGANDFTVTATSASLACASVALGVGAAVPLAVAPLLPAATPPGVTGFFLPKPVANIFI